MTASHQSHADSDARINKRNADWTRRVDLLPLALFALVMTFPPPLRYATAVYTALLIVYVTWMAWLGWRWWREVSAIRVH